MRIVRAHLRTVATRLARGLAPPAEPPSREWETRLTDPAVGSVRLTGKLSEAAGGKFLLAVHGLGGCADSHYLRLMALRAWERDWTVLRLNLRGADRLGEDYYHAALTADLEAAVATAAVRYGRRVAIVGYSLGGHVALLHATERPSERLAAVAAVCPPLDLAAGADHLDGPGPLMSLYRHYLLRHLKEIYDAVAARRTVPLPSLEAARIRTIRRWDDLVVAPRHGFTGAADYYARSSVGPRLASLRRPTLLVASPDDPMVPGGTLVPYLGGPVDGLDVRWERGGHVAFRRSLDLGQRAAPGLESQVLAWLESRLPDSGSDG